MQTIQGLTAIQAMQKELQKIKLAQWDCVTEEGFVKSHCRYKYQILVREAREYQDAIKAMELLKSTKR